MEALKLAELLKSTQIWYNIVYIIIGIGSLIILPGYLVSKYYYRPYGKSSAKDILMQYHHLLTLELNSIEQKTAIPSNIFKLRWQAYVAFTIEFDNNDAYIKNFPEAGPNFSSRYDKFIKEYEEVIRSNIINRIWKYVITFLKRKKGNIYEYYFYGEYIEPLSLFKGENINEKVND